MQKVDWRKSLKHLYVPAAKEVVEVDVPEMRFLMVDGEKAPSVSGAFAQASSALYALGSARFESFGEGRSAQVMHVGPYADEWPTIERVHGFIGERGGSIRGRHHEIYLNDPNRTAPERPKTVIRQPFA